MAFGDMPQPPADTPGDKEGSAKGILTQIKGLLHQYLDLGETTPLKGEAESFLTQVEDGLDTLEGVKDSPAEDAAEMNSDKTEDSPPSDFRSATRAAREIFSRGNGNSAGAGGSKTDQAQTQGDEVDKKKTKTKAGY